MKQSLPMIAAALLLAAGASSAHAQTLSEAQRREAAVHFERGSIAYERGDYAEAQAAFQTAYAITSHPDLLYNLYTAAERGGELEVAAEALEGYLRDGDPEPARREALEIRAERLQLRIAEQRAAAAEEAERAERERVAQAAQLEAARRAREEAEVSRASEHQSRIAQLEAGHATSDALLLTGVVTAAVAGAALVSFGVFAGLSEAEDGAIAGSCGRDAGRVCAPEELDALRSFNLAADASWIAAAGLGVTAGALMLIAEALRPGESPDVALSPAVGPTEAGLIVRGSL